MKTLYILGNGFDLHHNLRTRYSDFHEYLTINDPDLENQLSEYFNFSTCDKSYLWKSFEEDLAHYDHRAFFENYNHTDFLSESFKRSDCFGVEDEIAQETEAMVEKIQENFKDWIQSVEIENADLSQKIILCDDAVFINFNYTDTLELCYNVSFEDILYIHNNGKRDYNIIFGHGETEEADPAMDELDASGDSNRTPFTDAENAARAPFFSLFKNTEEVVAEHQDFWTRLVGIKKIYILGHSLGKVDLPYFQLINRLNLDADWHISYHTDNEQQSLESKLIERIGISEPQVNMIKINKLAEK